MLLRGEKLLQRKKEERRKQQQEEAARESTLGTESSTSDDGRESEKEEEDQPQGDCSVGQNCWVIKNWIAHSTVASESLECDSFN